jgi:NCAIR mutase (PurE)-related protein
MDEAALRILLDQLTAGEVGADEVVRRVRELPFAELGYAMVDHHRALRQGLPEAVFGPGKSVAQCVGIVGELLSGGLAGPGGGGPVVLSRGSGAQVAAVVAAYPGGVVTGSTVVWRPALARPEGVVVVTAGTADLVVAEECRATLRAFGFGAALVADAGVAGLHRLLAHVSLLQAADAVVVVAGMEGALASVVGGLCAAPVVAVPTSVAGYGAGLGGVTALLGMLASCASGLVVVGIDNGFGAACAVARSLGPAGRLPAPPSAAADRAVVRPAPAPPPVPLDPAAARPAAGRPVAG